MRRPKTTPGQDQSKDQTRNWGKVAQLTLSSPMGGAFAAGSAGPARPRDVDQSKGWEAEPGKRGKEGRGIGWRSGAVGEAATLFQVGQIVKGWAFLAFHPEPGLPCSPWPQVLRLECRARSLQGSRAPLPGA